MHLVGLRQWMGGLGWILLATVSVAQPRRTPTLGIEHGYLKLDTSDFNLRLIKDSQTLAELKPKGAKGFDFAPSDRLTERASDGFYHLGDINLRVRAPRSVNWKSYSSATERHPVTPLAVKDKTFAAADLAPTFPADFPLKITRRWAETNGRLALMFDIKNPGKAPVEIGGLGIPMVFNNIITNRDLPQAHERCSFSDPYIGLDAGYVQVTRLSGQGPALVVAPVGKTPFEAYRPLDEPMRRNQTFEGMLEWTVRSQAYAETDWKGVTQWNTPTSETLKPGQTRTIGVTFLLSDSIRNIEKTLAENHRPVAVGLPGYVLPMDQTGKLFLNYPSRVSNLSVEPKGALAWTSNREGKKGWRGYNIQAKTWGRARLTVTYADGVTQAVSYYVTKPAAQAVADLGHFLTTKQWFTDVNDPFGRAPSPISYDREADRQVVQDSRVWIAGLGDEGGSGSWLAAAMKEFGQPNREEVAKYEQFIDKVLWGNLQFKDGPDKFGVRKSVFFYEPALVPGFTYDSSRNWTSWTSWNRKATDDIGRGYNYPHVVAAYWSIYRIARNHPGMVTSHPWSWFLDQAYETTKILTDVDENGNDRVGYMQLGLMDGDVFALLLDDLKREGWKEKADLVEARMKKRADRWSHEAFPFGSEMAWDSTGQEEVFRWCKYFGFEDKAQVSLNSILGYMPTLPHWGYNGNARRYWDFLYGGKLSRIERQIHHYGSGLNAIPLLSEYREHPSDFYLLRVGYGGMMGALSNIDQEGFASAAFHSFPSTLKWDAYSGDYGPNFFGHAVDSATYLVNHPDFGWQAFGGNVKLVGDWVKVEPRDSFRTRVFVAPIGQWLTLDSGTFESVEFNRRSGAVRVTLSGPSLLRVEHPGTARVYVPVEKLAMERQAYIVKSRSVELKPNKK